MGSMGERSKGSPWLPRGVLLGEMAGPQSFHPFPLSWHKVSRLLHPTFPALPHRPSHKSLNKMDIRQDPPKKPGMRPTCSHDKPSSRLFSLYKTATTSALLQTPECSLPKTAECPTVCLAQFLYPSIHGWTLLS